MKLYRFLTRAFHDGRVVEPGEEVLCADNVVPGAHMLDVAAESEAIARGETPPVQEPERHDAGPVFRRDLAHSAGMPIDEGPASDAAPVASSGG